MSDGHQSNSDPAPIRPHKRKAKPPVKKPGADDTQAAVAATESAARSRAS